MEHQRQRRGPPVLMPVSADLRCRPAERPRRRCRLPAVLVATDFDGVLAPFVTDPMDARPLAGDHRGRSSALAELPGVARRRRLGSRPGDPAPASPASARDEPSSSIGSHGAQSQPACADQETTAAQPGRRQTARASCTADASRSSSDQHPEAAHRAQAGRRRRAHPRRWTLRWPRRPRGCRAGGGRAAYRASRCCRASRCVELSVVAADKGSAARSALGRQRRRRRRALLRRRRHRRGRLRGAWTAPRDVTVKVGAGDDAPPLPGRRRGRRGACCDPARAARRALHRTSCPLSDRRPAARRPCAATAQGTQGIAAVPVSGAGTAPVEPRTTSSGRKTYSARGAGSPGDLVEQRAHRRLAHRLHALAHRRQRRVGEGDERRVVVADHGEVARHLEAALAGRPDRAERHEVRAADDGRRTPVEQPAGRAWRRPRRRTCVRSMRSSTSSRPSSVLHRVAEARRSCG